MDEDEYRKTYQQITELQCVFEKALCSLRCNCSQGEMFRLADRHGVTCKNADSQQNCVALLNHLRSQTRFVFKINEIDGPFPHNKEIRVQNGGLLGIQKLLDGDASTEMVADVSSVVATAVEKYGSVENLPYDQIMPSVMAFKARPKRRNKK
ncbi:MAG: hypothetical protein OQL06_10270 [Gammaproteobacteria bacterium]|nr:hypothetical protein [Gammaproteobacteria bacterium]